MITYCTIKKSLQKKCCKFGTSSGNQSLLVNIWSLLLSVWGFGLLENKILDYWNQAHAKCKKNKTILMYMDKEILQKLTFKTDLYINRWYVLIH